MPQSDQGVTNDRYMLIPRTAIFVRRGEEYLLIKGAPTKRLWAGKYNGLGGHVERGEDALSAAQPQIRMDARLFEQFPLCGTVIVDAGEAGDLSVCLCGGKRSGRSPRLEGRTRGMGPDRGGGSSFQWWRICPSCWNESTGCGRGIRPFSRGRITRMES
ncbi:MAG: hypothetical protein HND47_10350 [Chloroflexi bacterium]|nr:hypothetical protein [Chloroflexota bacterium]